MLNCEKASLLASRAIDEKLPFKQKLALKLHLLLCRSCVNFTRQLNFLRETTNYVKKEGGLKLSDEAKQRISKALKNH